MAVGLRRGRRDGGGWKKGLEKRLSLLGTTLCVNDIKSHRMFSKPGLAAVLLLSRCHRIAIILWFHCFFFVYNSCSAPDFRFSSHVRRPSSVFARRKCAVHVQGCVSVIWSRVVPGCYDAEGRAFGSVEVRSHFVTFGFLGDVERELNVN